MKKSILVLLMIVTSVSLLSQNTYSVDVYYYDRTPKFVNYSPITTPSLKVSGFESTSTPSFTAPINNTTPNRNNIIEEVVRRERLLLELEELRELRRLRALERQENQSQTIIYPQETPNKATTDIFAVYSESPLYDIPNFTQGKTLTSSKDGKVRILRQYNEQYYIAEMNGVQGYLWSGWLKKE